VDELSDDDDDPMDGSKEDLDPIKIMTWNLMGLEEIMQKEEAVSFFSLVVPSSLIAYCSLLALFSGIIRVHRRE